MNYNESAIENQISTEEKSYGNIEQQLETALGKRTRRGYRNNLNEGIDDEQFEKYMNNYDTTTQKEGDMINRYPKRLRSWLSPLHILYLVWFL